MGHCSVLEPPAGVTVVPLESEAAGLPAENQAAAYADLSLFLAIRPATETDVTKQEEPNTVINRTLTIKM